MTPPVLWVWGRQAIANDMARLQELEDDLRHDINERSKMTSSNRKLAKEQQRQAMRRRREKKRQHAREHADVPDTTWKFGDNDDIARAQANARRLQRQQLDEQRKQQQELAATLNMSARGTHQKLGFTGNRAPPQQNASFFPGPRDIVRGKVVPPEAAEAAYREAYQRHERSLQDTLKLARRKDAEVKREAERLDKEYIRRVRGHCLSALPCLVYAVPLALTTVSLVGLLHDACRRRSVGGPSTQ